MTKRLKTKLKTEMLEWPALRSPNDINKRTELNRWIGTASLWDRKAVSRISLDVALDRWPTSRIKSDVEEAQVPSVSRAIGWKISLCVRHEYLASFRDAASSAAPPTVWLEECMYDWASVLATVISQVNGLPPSHGNKVNTSGHLT